MNIRLEPTRVLVVDDHQLMLDAVRAALADEEELEVVGEAKDAEQALTLLERRRPDVVLLDVRLPGVDGLECLRRIRDARPDVKVVIFTGVEDTNVLRRALDGGASAVVSKLVDPRDLAATLRQVVEETVVALPSHVERHDDGLSDREREILRWLAAGAPTKQIALQVGLSEQAVKYHLTRLYAKFGVGGRIEAVRIALERGLVDGAPTAPPVRAAR